MGFGIFITENNNSHDYHFYHTQEKLQRTAVAIGEGTAVSLFNIFMEYIPAEIKIIGPQKLKKKKPKHKEHRIQEFKSWEESFKKFSSNTVTSLVL